MGSSHVLISGVEFLRSEGIELARSLKEGIRFLLIMVPVVVCLGGCSIAVKVDPTTQPLPVATPVSEMTPPAYRPGSPIVGQQAAISAARVSLEQSRLRYINAPKVVSVEQIKLEDAHKRVAQLGLSISEDRPGDTMVWLVIFEGEWQIIPPDPRHTATPAPPIHGCAYVIMNASDGERAEVGGIECK